MSSLRITISRTGLGLPDLIIGDQPGVLGSRFWVTADGMSNVDLSWRLTYAPDSAWVSGKKLLAAVLEASSLPMTVMVGPESSPERLADLRRELVDAVSQFFYTTTVDVDGVSEAWSCDPAYPQWGPLTHELSEKNLARAALVIPVNP